MGNKSVVVNYKSNEIFATNDSPDVGYVQFVKTADRVYITVDGKSVGFVLAEEFNRIQLMFDATNEMAQYALCHGYGR